MQLRKGVLGGLVNGWAYIRGGGRCYKRNKKKKGFDMSHSSVAGNTFLIY